jgi:hypothetical protein
MGADTRGAGMGPDALRVASLGPKQIRQVDIRRMASLDIMALNRAPDNSTRRPSWL